MDIGHINYAAALFAVSFFLRSMHCCFSDRADVYRAYIQSVG